MFRAAPLRGGFEFVEVNKGTHSVYKGMLKGLDCEKNMKGSYSPGGTKVLFGARPFVQSRKGRANQWCGTDPR